MVAFTPGRLTVALLFPYVSQRSRGDRQSARQSNPPLLVADPVRLDLAEAAIDVGKGRPIKLPLSPRAFCSLKTELPA
jgi:hypothetical protein